MVFSNYDSSLLKLRRYTVGWGEYGTAGVKSAPFYLKNVMSWRKMLLH